MSDEHKIAKSAGEIVKSFYDKHGWQNREGGWSGEDILFRTFPEAHVKYAKNADARTAACFDDRNGILLLAGCGDVPEFHLNLAQRFNRIFCMDISPVALGIARSKLGDTAEYFEESITKTSLADVSVDAVYCAHVIYHIAEELQERAVNELIRVTKRGGRLVVVYVNSKSPVGWPRSVKQVIERIRLRQMHVVETQDSVPKLYNYVRPLGWWRRFSPQCHLSFLPSEVIGSRAARALLRTQGMASLFFAVAQWIENRFPRPASWMWQYSIIVLDKI
jgi:SAM-dependent methyltransferase